MNSGQASKSNRIRTRYTDKQSHDNKREDNFSAQGKGEAGNANTAWMRMWNGFLDDSPCWCIEVV